MNKQYILGGATFFLIVIIMTVFKFNPWAEDLNQSKTSIADSAKEKSQVTANSNDPSQVSASVTNNVLASTSTTKPPSINTADPLDQALDIMLRDNLVINGLPARKLKDGTVIIDTRGRLKTVSVARLNEDGEIVMSEYQESPLQLNEVSNP